MPNIDQTIVVIGASAGGTEALINVVAGLPAGCSASIFIVQHVPAHADSHLSEILGRKTGLRVVTARDGAQIEPGTIYCAVPDHHLLIEEGRVLVTKGPKENRFRPAVDALFRSAAYAYRSAVVGVVLSGALNDGTSGLWRIKHLGGTTIIQDLDDAIFDSMPRSAKQHVQIDYELPSNEIGLMIHQLSLSAASSQSSTVAIPNDPDHEFVAFEIAVAKGKNALERGVLDFGNYSPLTCPDCHGALTEYQEGPIKRFRCHTGHAHTAESLLSGIDAGIEKSMWEAMRGMEEGKLLLEQLAVESQGKGNDEAAEVYRSGARRFTVRSKIIKDLILGREATQTFNDLPKDAEFIK